MSVLATLGRPMLAGMFIRGGVSQLLDADDKAAVAEDVVHAVDSVVDAHAPVNPMPSHTSDAVRLNGAIQVAAGTMLALGKLPRLAALALAASLVPTTLAAHRFWDEGEPAARSTQQIHFLKNVAMLGGLLIAADDTGGRPSIGWRAGRAVEHASDSLSEHAASAAGAVAGLRN